VDVGAPEPGGAGGEAALAHLGPRARWTCRSSRSTIVAYKAASRSAGGARAQRWGPRSSRRCRPRSGQLGPHRGQPLVGLAASTIASATRNCSSETLLLSGSRTSHSSGDGASKAPFTVMALLMTKRPTGEPPRRRAV
jgi:hypothetical protein